MATRLLSISNKPPTCISNPSLIKFTKQVATQAVVRQGTLPNQSIPVYEFKLFLNKTSFSIFFFIVLQITQ